MSDLTPEVRDLLAAVREALNVPLAALTDADEQARASILSQRASLTRTVLDGILDRDRNIARAVTDLAERTADTPITYTAWQRPAPDGES